ncbi:MAG: hypothetical protein HEEMFOPI_01302 [Holosporales bacterium]
MKNKLSLKILYGAWFLLTLFYAFQYFLRVAPSVMANDLRCDFNLTAEQFALFPAIYLYAYGLLQIPIGYFLDIVGAKKTILGSIFVCLIGAALFYSTQNIYVAYFSRFLIGAGSAAAFITPLKIIGDLFPNGQKGLFMGLTLAVGTAGPLLAGKPLSQLIQAYGWRGAGLLTCLGGVVIFVLIALLIPKKEKMEFYTKKPESLDDIFNAFKKVIKNKQVLLYAIIAFGLYAPLSALSDTWGISFIMEKYNYTREVAAEATSFIFIGLCLGSFMIPAFFEPRKMMKIGIQSGLVLMFLCYVAVLYNDHLSLMQLKALLFFFGFLVGAEMLCFTGISSASEDGLRGLSLGVANTINMVGGAILQQLIGILLDTFWSGTYTEQHIRSYTQLDFQYTLSAFIVIYAVCIVMTRYLPRDKR